MKGPATVWERANQEIGTGADRRLQPTADSVYILYDLWRKQDWIVRLPGWDVRTFFSLVE